MRNLGMLHAAQEQWESALESYAEAENLAKGMGTMDVLANILVSRALAQIGVGDLKGGERTSRQARAYMGRLRDRLGAECNKVDGIILRERGQYLEAEELLLEGRVLFKDLENLLGAAECTLELGIALQRRALGLQQLQIRGFAHIVAAAGDLISALGSRQDLLLEEDDLCLRVL